MQQIQPPPAPKKKNRHLSTNFSVFTFTLISTLSICLTVASMTPVAVLSQNSASNEMRLLDYSKQLHPYPWSKAPCPRYN